MKVENRLEEAVDLDFEWLFSLCELRNNPSCSESGFGESPPSAWMSSNANDLTVGAREEGTSTQPRAEYIGFQFLTYDTFARSKNLHNAHLKVFFATFEWISIQSFIVCFFVVVNERCENGCFGLLLWTMGVIFV